MKVCTAPNELTVPTFDFLRNPSDIRDDTMQYLADLKVLLISKGYTGKETGGIFSIAYEDGFALYMFADAPSGECLIHLPLGDAWNNPAVTGLTKEHVTARLSVQ